MFAWALLEHIVKSLLIEKTAAERALENANWVLRYHGLSCRETLIRYAKPRQLYYWSPQFNQDNRHLFY